jgi:hypothetical protein
MTGIEDCKMSSLLNSMEVTEKCEKVLACYPHCQFFPSGCVPVLRRSPDGMQDWNEVVTGETENID